MNPVSWHLISGKSLDFKSSIGAYTLNLSQGMAESGCDVHLWISAGSGEPQYPSEFRQRIKVHRVPSLWKRSSFRFIGEALDKISGVKRLFVQFAPDSFGEQEWNLALPGWLEERRAGGDELWLMVHKTYRPGWKIWRPGRWMVSLLQKMMLRRSVYVCHRNFVSSPGLIPYLEELAEGYRLQITWLPIPSNVQRVDNAGRARNLRKAFAHDAPSVIGTFGSYRDRKLVRLLRIVVPKLLKDHPGRVWLCLGRESESMVEKMRQENPGIASQLELAGELDPEALSAHIQACDVMLQPYPLGVDTSRTSIMVGLSHSRAVVTTQGPATEKIWRSSGCVCLCPGDRPDVLPESVAGLLEDRERREQLAATAGAIYEKNFSMKVCIRTLLESGD